jgi:hypothetical protein
LILLSVILISTIAIEVGKKVGGKNEQRSWRNYHWNPKTTSRC